MALSFQLAVDNWTAFFSVVAVVLVMVSLYSWQVAGKYHYDHWTAISLRAISLGIGLMAVLLFVPAFASLNS